jgi:hypothetical protein
MVGSVHTAKNPICTVASSYVDAPGSVLECEIIRSDLNKIHNDFDKSTGSQLCLDTGTWLLQGYVFSC